MRPLRLEIEGLTSFRQRQEIHFDGFDLFVITGPTGAGKTTILDAMTLALYGEISRTGKKNAAELVTHGDTRARVMFEFRADGQTYRVGRVLPRNGAQKAILERREGDDWLPEVEESGVKPINARIEAIIGLDFDSFTRAVLLPQGEFAKFLAGDARQRREILVRLLELGRYERAGQLARQEANSLNSDISAKSQLVAEDYADATKEGVSAAVEAATAAKAHADLMTRSGDKVDQLVSRLTDLENQLSSIQRGAAALGGVVKTVDTLAKEWTKLLPQRTETHAALLSAETGLEESGTAYRKAAAVLETVRDGTGDESLLAALDSACTTTEQEAKAIVGLSEAISATDQNIDRLARALAAAVNELENAKTRHAAVRLSEDTCRQQAGQIDQALHQARERAEAERDVARLTAESRRWHNELEARRGALKELEAAARVAEDRLNHLNGEHAVIGIRTELVVDKPCPVCLQLVRKIPASSSDIISSITAAENDARVARQRLRKAEEAVAEATGEVKAADRSLTNATKTLERVGSAPLLTDVDAKAAALKAKLAKVVAEREAVTHLSFASRSPAANSGARGGDRRTTKLRKRDSRQSETVARRRCRVFLVTSYRTAAIPVAVHALSITQPDHVTADQRIRA
jgi:exonuclease SbcC